MSKVAVVFYSSGGNTEEMANAIAEEVKAKGSEASVIACGDFSEGDVGSYDSFAFGCSAQGAEELETGEFEPMWDAVKGSLSGKKVVLFGSYGWGGGEWMTKWEENAKEAGVIVAGTAICNGSPDDTAISESKALAGKLV